MDNRIKILIADESHIKYVPTILKAIKDAAKIRGTGIAKRTAEYLELKMRERKAIIALDDDDFAGFCYIESWGNKQYVANSGLVVAEPYRRQGLARKIKEESFKLSRARFPDAKLFGLTSGAAIMKINTDLGYIPVSFAELTDDDAFWRGCQGCVNYDILERTNRKYCICTAMLYDPALHKR
jgi:GNAT superfamily N-acetyltransferase